MSVPWYAGSFYATAMFGGQSPDPVTTADQSWTWDLEFSPVKSSLYARASLNTFGIVGGGSNMSGCGIVEYRTRNKNGKDTVHHVGNSDPDGYVDFMWDTNVDSVTFGWIIQGDNYCWGRLNMEVWG